MTRGIPIRTVEGPEEVTVWLWPNSPQPVTVTVDSEKWEAVQAKAEEETDGSVAKFIAQAIERDLAKKGI